MPHLTILTKYPVQKLKKNYIKAQSYALRAFYYYMLVNQYGLPYNYNKESLGVPLKLDSKMRDDDNILMRRNTVEEVYRQIVTDLNEAERLFLTLSATQQYEPNYLVSLPMVQLLKSRVALYMENWEEAKNVCGESYQRLELLTTRSEYYSCTGSRYKRTLLHIQYI